MMDRDAPARREALARSDVERSGEALSALVGARVDRVYFCEATGLLSLSTYDRGKRVLSVGVGPIVWGIGLGEAVPRVRDDASRSLVAALRAHIVDHRIRSALIEDGLLWLAVGGEGALARLSLCPGRRGGATVYAADGRVIARFPAAATAREPESEWGDERPFESRGDALVALSDKRGFDRAKTQLAKAVRAAQSAVERRAEAVRGDLARLGSVEALQKIGRLLLAQGANVPRGAARATLDDWDTGEPLEVKLDPSKPAKAQAETFFAKARRYQRGEAVMRKRLAECDARAASLIELARHVSDATPEDGRAWSALVSRARALGAKVEDERPAGGSSSKGGREPKRRPFHVFRDERGRKILVGRGGADNDALTTEVARPHDLWLHAKERTGAHVVVQLDKGQSCPSETLIDAATLAVHFSDARGELVCDVTHVQRRYVRKPKGSAPGAVTYDHEKVLVLRVEPERVERLLATREE